MVAPTKSSASVALGDLAVLMHRDMLDRSIVSYFGPRHPRSVLNLVKRLLAGDVQVVNDLLHAGPSDLRDRFKAKPDVVEYVRNVLARDNLEFTDRTALLLRAINLKVIIS